jgi:tetratricopeptide (TPR) repeat protein
VVLVARGAGFDAAPDVQVRRRILLGRALAAAGLVGRASETREDTVRLAKAKLPAKHEARVTADSDWALSLVDEQRLGEAASIQAAVLDARRKRTGERHVDYAQALNNLSETLSQVARKFDDLADLEKARTLGEKSVSLYASLLGPSHAETLRARVGVAITLSEQARLLDGAERAVRLRLAIDTYEDIIRMFEADGRQGDVVCMRAMNSLCIALDWAGHPEAAIAPWKRLIALRTSRLGAAHPATLTASINFAVTLRRVDPDAAIQALEPTLRTCWTTLPKGHSATCVAAVWLFNWLRQDGAPWPSVFGSVGRGPMLLLLLGVSALLRGAPIPGGFLHLDALQEAARWLPENARQALGQPNADVGLVESLLELAASGG